MHLPPARGPLSSALIDVLLGRADVQWLVQSCSTAETSPAVDVSVDDDLQLTLYLMYELHYGALAGVPDSWEWQPDVLRARAVLEGQFERALRTAAQVPPRSRQPIARTLFAMARSDSGPSVASFVARHATRAQVAEALVLRSPYQLKEGDPQTFAIPRLRGRAKAALVEIQSDEYGGGRAERMHSALFARSMRALGLDDEPNAYLDHVPALVLASNNALSLFALHRRLSPALCGHLAAFEMTSSIPAKRWVAGMQRLGLGADAWGFFDEHIEADAVHEQIAAQDLCGALLDEDRTRRADILLGAQTCLALDRRVDELVLQAWQQGRSALRRPLPESLQSESA